jgi:lactate racemase-like protein
MKKRLAHGESGLDVELPAGRTTVVEPAYDRGAADERAVLRQALRAPVAGPPLREIVRPGQTVAISMCDGTRAQPRHLMIPAVLEEIDGIVTATTSSSSSTRRARATTPAPSGPSRPVSPASCHAGGPCRLGRTRGRRGARTRGACGWGCRTPATCATGWACGGGRAS